MRRVDGCETIRDHLTEESSHGETLSFPFSHFCEKARWAPDYKQHGYQVCILLPLFHLATTLRRGKKTSVPLLVEGQLVLQDSSDIIDYLDLHYPDKPLTPALQEDGVRAREWERMPGEDMGVSLRCWFYFHTLPDTPHARYFLEQDLPESRRRTLRLCFPLVRRAMQIKMRISPRVAKQALDRLDNVVSQLSFLWMQQLYEHYR